MDLAASVTAFAQEAQQFCDWLERDNSRDELTVARRLAHLYARGLDLPDVDPEQLAGFGTPPLPEALMQNVMASLTAVPFQYYWEVFDSVRPQADVPVCGDLVDDLRDTYSDVKKGLLAYQQGHRVLAAWHWRTTCGFHWGRHVASALKALASYERPAS